MNTIVGKHGLKALAEELADEFNSRHSTLLNELSELERKKSEKGDEIKASEDAVERVRNFQPEINDELQCPECYVFCRLQSPIRPMHHSHAFPDGGDLRW
jgi:predicted nuclease with TOPRIM domain